MFLDLCVCGLVPLRQTRTRVIILMHHIEAMRQSNTGRLVLAGVAGAEVRLRGLPDRPMDLRDALSADHRPLLLYPSPDARDLDESLLAEDPRPVTLFVPDGTWNHARKIPLRQMELKDITRVRLPFERDSEYQLRRAPHRGHLSTIEAVARALGVLEGPEARRDLEEIFRVARDRTLWSQGRLAENLVSGGLPFRDKNPAPDARGRV